MVGGRSNNSTLSLVQSSAGSDGGYSSSSGTTGFGQRPSFRRHSSSSSEVTSRALPLRDGRGVGGKLVIVDLAGSERLGKSRSEGVTRAEAVSINSSLHALSQVIQALAIKAAHVPTRSSKLTQVLDGYLRGGSLLHLLVCVSPHATHLPETYCSLEFAKRAMHIQKLRSLSRHSEEQRHRSMRNSINLLTLVRGLNEEAAARGTHQHR